MKSTILAGLLMSIVYSDTLIYGENIGAFDFEWSNPDIDSSLYATPDASFNYSLMTDSDIDTGEALSNPTSGKVLVFIV